MKRHLPAVGVVLFLVALFAFLAVGSLPSPTDLRDFGGAIASVQALNLGLNPYGRHPTLPANPELQGITPNINLPMTLILLQPLAVLDPRTAYLVWLMLSVASYIAVLVYLRRLYPLAATPLRILWAAALVPLWWTFYWNQVYVALLVAVLFAVHFLERGKLIAAALTIGFLVAVKPNFAVLPAVLILSGSRRVGAGALAFAGVLSLVPLIIYGPTIYAQWYTTISSANQQLMLAGNLSLWGLFAHLGATWIGQGLSVALLAILALWAWSTRPSVNDAIPLAIATALLATPVSWPGYMILLLPWFFRSKWSTAYRFAALAYVTPFPVGLLYTLTLLGLVADSLWPAAHSLLRGMHVGTRGRSVDAA